MSTLLSPLEVLVIFAAVMIVVHDLVWSIGAMMMTGTPNALVCKRCENCGAEIGSELWSVMTWRYLTHRCDDNLAGP